MAKNNSEIVSPKSKNKRLIRDSESDESEEEEHVTDKMAKNKSRLKKNSVNNSENEIVSPKSKNGRTIRDSESDESEEERHVTDKMAKNKSRLKKNSVNNSENEIVSPKSKNRRLIRDSESDESEEEEHVTDKMGKNKSRLKRNSDDENTNNESSNNQVKRSTSSYKKKSKFIEETSALSIASNKAPFLILHRVKVNPDYLKSVIENKKVIKNKDKKFINKKHIEKSFKENTSLSKSGRVLKSINYEDDSSDDEKSNCSNESDEDDRFASAKIKDLICTYCGTTFKKYLSLKHHIGINHKYAYKCSICSDRFTFNDLYSYKCHMKEIHPEIKPYPCDYPRCFQNFAKAKELRDHMKMHLPFMCKYCEKGFAFKRHMRIHVQKHHLSRNL